MAEKSVSSVLLAARTERRELGVFFAVAVLLLVILSDTILSLRAIHRVISQTDSVEHTRLLMRELDATLVDLLNAETGERGYLYTGQARYLGPYRIGTAEIEAHLNQLAALAKDNPIQRENVSQLQPLVRQRMGLLRRAVELADSGQRGGARAIVLANTGKDVMDGARTVIARMEGEELKLLAQRSAEAQRSVRFLLLAIPLANGFTAVLLVLAGLLLSREMRGRAAAATKLHELVHSEHKARQEAESAHHRIDNILSSISESFLLLDHDWRILYVNAEALKMSGKTREEMIGRTYWEVFPDSEGTKFEDAFRRAMKTQRPEVVEEFYAPLRK